MKILVKTNKKTMVSSKSSLWDRLKDQKFLIFMSAPFVIWVIVYL